MNITMDVQPLLGRKSGVGFYIWGLIHALSQIDSKNQYHLAFFDFKNRQHVIPDLAANFKKRKSVIPGRMVSALWKKLKFPSYDFFFGKADLFHFPNFIIRPIREGKTIATIHDVSFLRFPQYTEPKNLKFLTDKIEETVLRANQIIVDSEFTKSELLSFFKIDSTRVHSIHLGIDSHFQPSLNHEASKKILFVGTIEPRKNLTHLFKAFDLFTERMKEQNYQLIIAGMKGWLYEETFRSLEKCKSKERIHLLNYVDDHQLIQLYQEADLFVYPSFYEGFGLPPLEAMASGVPVIAAKRGSLGEVLGEAPAWIEPEDIEGLAKNMERVLCDQEYKQMLIAKGLLQAKKFNWKTTAEQTLDVYYKAMGLSL